MFISTDYIVPDQFHQLLFFVCSTGFTGLTSVFTGFYRTVSSLFISTDYIVPDHFHQLLFFVCSTGFTWLTSVSTGFYWVPLILCPFPPITMKFEWLFVANDCLFPFHWSHLVVWFDSTLVRRVYLVLPSFSSLHLLKSSCT